MCMRDSSWPPAHSHLHTRWKNFLTCTHSEKTFSPAHTLWENVFICTNNLRKCCCLLPSCRDKPTTHIRWEYSEKTWHQKKTAVQVISLREILTAHNLRKCCCCPAEKSSSQMRTQWEDMPWDNLQEDSSSVSDFLILTADDLHKSAAVCNPGSRQQWCPRVKQESADLLTIFIYFIWASGNMTVSKQNQQKLTSTHA